MGLAAWLFPIFGSHRFGVHNRLSGQSLAVHPVQTIRQEGCCLESRRLAVEGDLLHRRPVIWCFLAMLSTCLGRWSPVEAYLFSGAWNHQTSDGAFSFKLFWLKPSAWPLSYPRRDDATRLWMDPCNQPWEFQADQRWWLPQRQLLRRRLLWWQAAECRRTAGKLVQCQQLLWGAHRPHALSRAKQWWDGGGFGFSSFKAVGSKGEIPAFQCVKDPVSLPSGEVVLEKSFCWVWVSHGGTNFQGVRKFSSVGDVEANKWMFGGCLSGQVCHCKADGSVLRLVFSKSSSCWGQLRWACFSHMGSGRCQLCVERNRCRWECRTATYCYRA